MKVSISRVIIGIECLLLFCTYLWYCQPKGITVASDSAKPEEKYIKWVDFTVPYEALQQAYELDVSTYEQEVHLNWIELLACLGARYGGDFGSYSSKDMKDLGGKLTSGETTMGELTKDMKYYAYYLEAYTAVLGGMVGEYEIQVPKEDAQETDTGAQETGEKVWVKQYGLKAYSPIARGYEYQDYDDFGVSRSYGYRRQHLGHDMMGQVGTPIRITYRMKLKNNMHVPIVISACLYSLFNQFILFLVTQRFKIIEQATNIIIYHLFGFGVTLRNTIVHFSSNKARFQLPFIFIKIFNLLNDVGGCS